MDINNKLFKEICDLSLAGITVSDPSKPDNPLIYVNPAFEKITGYSKEEAINKNCRYLQGNDEQSVEKEIINDALKNHKSCRVTLRNYRKDGTLFYNELLISPSFDENGNLKNFIGIQNDVTEIFEYKNKLEDKISKQLDVIRQRDLELYEFIKLKSAEELIENISHQWRQPLNMISMSASAIKTEKEFDVLNGEMLDNYIVNILDNTRYLSDLLNKFSDYTDISLNTLRDISINAEIDKALDILKGKLNNSNIEVKLDLGEKNVVKKMKGDYINEIILELLSNAIEVLIDRKIDNPWIKISLSEKDDDIFIKLEDNAGGIKNQVDINDIFLPYSTTKHKALDVGLSLNYIYRVVKYKLNGLIEVHNTENGAQFILKIPKYSSMKDLKILYIEDDDLERNIFQNLLQKDIDTVVSFDNGFKALEEIKTNTEYDLLILDLKMPKMDGITFIKELKKLNISLPIIITSAYIDEDNIKELRKLDVNHHFSKPINYKRFLESMQEIMMVR